MANQNFKPIFEAVDDLENRMRNCQSREDWQVLREEYRNLLANAQQVYQQYSTEDKFKAFKQRHNNAILAIHTNLKQYWERQAMGLEMQEKPAKVYILYDQSKFDEDLAKECEYWHNELFPKAAKENWADYEVEYAYAEHLWGCYWKDMCGNPTIRFKNERRLQWDIFKKEFKGNGMSAEEIANLN